MCGLQLQHVEVRQPSLRRRVPTAALRRLVGARFTEVQRRAKYLVFSLDRGSSILLHLGMSGSLRLLHATPDCEVVPLGAHDHVRWWLGDDSVASLELRFRDPRRFGLVEVAASARLSEHGLLAHLGPEPLGPDFSSTYLQVASRHSRRPLKNFLMDARIVVGVGNIYAVEALWLARVHPAVPVRRISALRWGRIYDACVEVLSRAIEAGGTTLRDFHDLDGNLGYFALDLMAYGREGEACRRCARTIRRVVQAGRSSFYCPGCQFY